jgi:hypothetical protein
VDLHDRRRSAGDDGSPPVSVGFRYVFKPD